MSRLEDIHTGIWADPPFEDLTPPATLLYLWSWTNPLCGMAGIYRVSRRGMTASKVEPGQIDDALAELEQARFAFYEQDVLFVRARVKRLRQKTPQIAKAIANDLRQLDHDHPQRARFLAEYGPHSWLAEALATLDTPSGDPHLSVTDSGSQSQIPRPSGDPHPRVLGTGTGKGTGKGKAVRTDARALSGAELRVWANSYLGDLPYPEVMRAVTRLQLRPGFGAMTPDRVRGYIDEALAA